MKQIIRYVLPATLVILPSAVFAQADAKPAKEKRICKSDAAIGTLVPQRTCRTASEWKDIAKANDRAMQQMRTENAPGTQNGGSGPQ